MALEWINKIDGVDENSAGDVNALAAAIKDNEAAIAGKVDKESEKGLSSNDYTDAEKTKLSGIEAGANKYEHPASHPASMITGLGDAASKNTGTAAGTVAAGDHNHDDTYLKSETDPTVPAWAKSASKPTYTAAEVGADPAGSAAGVQGNLDAHVGNTAVHVTSAEKSGWNSKLSQSNIKAGANVTVTTSGNDVTISSAGGGEPAPLINNLTTTTAGQGALDAAQGKILNDTKANINHNHDGTYQPAGNYLTSESDPTVPAWAKATSKPAYTASEVGAVPTTGGTVTGDLKVTSQLKTNVLTSENDVFGVVIDEDNANINFEFPTLGYSATLDMAGTTVDGVPELQLNDSLRILGSPTPVSQDELANKQYVDTGLASKAPAYTYGTADMTAGVSPLETGTIYLMYE